MTTNPIKFSRVDSAKFFRTLNKRGDNFLGDWSHEKIVRQEKEETED